MRSYFLEGKRYLDPRKKVNDVMPLIANEFPLAPKTARTPERAIEHRVPCTKIQTCHMPKMLWHIQQGLFHQSPQKTDPKSHNERNEKKTNLTRTALKCLAKLFQIRMLNNTRGYPRSMLNRVLICCHKHGTWLTWACTSNSTYTRRSKTFATPPHLFSSQLPPQGNTQPAFKDAL